MACKSTWSPLFGRIIPKNKSRAGSFASGSRAGKGAEVRSSQTA